MITSLLEIFWRICHVSILASPYISHWLSSLAYCSVIDLLYAATVAHAPWCTHFAGSSSETRGMGMWPCNQIYFRKQMVVKICSFFAEEGGVGRAIWFVYVWVFCLKQRLSRFFSIEVRRERWKEIKLNIPFSIFAKLIGSELTGIEF